MQGSLEQALRGQHTLNSASEGPGVPQIPGNTELGGGLLVCLFFQKCAGEARSYCFPKGRRSSGGWSLRFPCALIPSLFFSGPLRGLFPLAQQRWGGWPHSASVLGFPTGSPQGSLAAFRKPWAARGGSRAAAAGPSLCSGL